ncbi:MAG: hypothetical protein LBG80_10415 [Bacteroidales bacterium]|jgi:hypothetical protein|nr:hypothetical protein [Bacteroidales bacterium]
MKTRCLILMGLFFVNGLYSQNIIKQLKEFYANADFAWYEQKIQEDLMKFDSFLINNMLRIIDSLPYCPYRPANIDLSKENKVFVLSIALANTEQYSFEDNIYDYLIIDSLRTFVIVCVDDKMNVKGFTDTEERGTYIDIKDDFFYPEKKQRRQIRKIIKNITKENPDLILFCDSWDGTFLYIKDELIYLYHIKTGQSLEFNEHVRKCPDINMIRRSNFILWPLNKKLEVVDGHPIDYRLTGHTPSEEVRLCPPLSK